MKLFASLFLWRWCITSIILVAISDAAAFFTAGDYRCCWSFSSTLRMHHHHNTRSSVLSFTQGRKTTSTRAASSSSSSDSNNDAEQERMALVRQLQKSFYAPSSSSSSSSNHTNDNLLDEPSGVRIDYATGRVLNLPLWRVGWVEVLGRTNCLNVHEGHYTNMFEKILQSNDGNNGNWWFGHLHLPGGTTNSRSGEKRFVLKDWRMERADDTRFDEDQKERSAVIGSLMRITDYRRLKDGRLCLLVQAVDRFVVDEVLQSFPHGLAHVQILPDMDHYNDDDRMALLNQRVARVARAALVKQAFQCYDYECRRLVLPLPKDDEYMATDEVFGVEIARQLPFCSFAATDDSLLLLSSDELQDQTTDSVNQDWTILPATLAMEEEPRLEDLLQADLILRNPEPLPGVIRRMEKPTTYSVDALEKLLWLALEDLCRNYKFQLPPEIMCLLPPEMDHLDLKQQKPDDGVQPVLHHLSKKYPVRRRQQRLSYAVPALMERTNIGSAITTRQMLLNTPSTRARLAAVLERVEVMNAAITGQFE